MVYISCILDQVYILEFVWIYIPDFFWIYIPDFFRFISWIWPQSLTQQQILFAELSGEKLNTLLHLAGMLTQKKHTSLILTLRLEHHLNLQF